ncbi:WhiB family transcription factor [Gordonia phage Santhid]|uniref:WhiB family transcription factor n=1 Tax=Gordonia phage Santhid TaxID=2927281 RepID=A0AAE9GPH4_9CAUD|nr:WhiB family transcription factor [Gordonia phage Santhid]UOK18029.1 WhiB family transcription factor [Gordonia phage Santhid]
MFTRPPAEILDTNDLPCTTIAPPDEWFPEHARKSPRLAQSGCARCPVVRACAAHALACERQGPPIFGVWAGVHVTTYSGASRATRALALAELARIAAGGDISPAPTAHPEKAAS